MPKTTPTLGMVGAGAGAGIAFVVTWPFTVLLITIPAGARETTTCPDVMACPGTTVCVPTTILVPPGATEMTAELDRVTTGLGIVGTMGRIGTGGMTGATGVVGAGTGGITVVGAGTGGDSVGAGVSDTTVGVSTGTGGFEDGNGIGETVGAELAVVIGGETGAVFVGPAGSGVDAGAAGILADEDGTVSDAAVGVVEGAALVGAEPAPMFPQDSPVHGATGVGGSKIPNSPPSLRPHIAHAPLMIC